jgi:hypothetical protein
MTRRSRLAARGSWHLQRTTMRKAIAASFVAVSLLALSFGTAFAQE